MREVFEPARWNAAVKALGGSIAQSWEWGLFHQSLGWEPVRLLDEEGRGAVQLLLKGTPPREGSVAYAPYGPLAASTADLVDITESAARWARGYGAYLLKIEPRLGGEVTREILKAGGRYVRAGVELPVRTFIVELPQDPQEHLKTLHKGVRYKIRRADRHGVRVLTLSSGSPDIDDKMAEFLKLLEDTSERQGFSIAPEAFYKNLMRDLPAHLLLAYHEETPVAGIIAVSFGEEAYYLFGASAERGNLYAPYLLQWEVMDAARRAGCSRYDMWGLPPSRYDEWNILKFRNLGEPEQEGLYRFKKQFGGTFMEYAGAYIRILNYAKLLEHGAASLGRRALYSPQSSFLYKFRGKVFGHSPRS